MAEPEAAAEEDWEAEEEEIRSRYIAAMAPLFFPEKPTDPDIVELFAALLRASGMEEAGWDPYAESRAVLDDLFALMNMRLPKSKFKDSDLTVWRLGLLFYSHVVEMDAPYEVLTNLLRYRLKKGFAFNPYFESLSKDEQKRAAKAGLFPKQKIKIIKQLSAEAGLGLGDIFDEFFRNDLRNAISHSDFIFTEEGFRCRSINLRGSFKVSFEELNALIRKSKIFIGTFFQLEREARRAFGAYGGKGLGYDPVYKGIMEVLADNDGLMNGFKVHWPNMSESYFRRSAKGNEMVNCILSAKQPAIEMFVGLYAKNKGAFSPLVEVGEEPRYTPLEGTGEPPVWQD